MTVAKDKMVSVTYELRLDGKDGEIFESATKENALKFLYGAGMMIPAFEAGLESKKVGDSFEIAIPAVDGYGEVNEEAIVDIPKTVFLVDGKYDEEMLSPGNNIPMMTSNGQRMTGMVVEVNDENVKMDFNHPLAGEDLFFTGEIIEVRDASEEELKSMLGGGCSCGCESEECGSGSCGDSNGSGCGCC